MSSRAELCQPLSSGNISLTTEAEGLVLVLRGQVDGSVVSAFLATWDGCPPPLAGIDAGQVSLLDGSGLRFLVHWAHAARLLGAPAVLRRASQPVWRLIDSAGVTEVFARTACPTSDRRWRRPALEIPSQGRRDSGASR